MTDLAEKAVDAPMEALVIALANMLEHPRIQADEDLMGHLVLLGAGSWRRTGEFKSGGPQTVQ